MTIMNWCPVSQKVSHAKEPLLLNGHVPSIGQNSQPISGNGDVSIWVKNPRMGRKTPNKQNCKGNGLNYFLYISKAKPQGKFEIHVHFISTAIQPKIFTHFQPMSLHGHVASVNNEGIA